MPHISVKLYPGGSKLVARAVGFAIERPDDVDIDEILFRPTRREL